MRQLDFADVAAEVFENADGLVDEIAGLAFEIFEILARDAEGDAADVTVERGAVIRHGREGRSCVHFIAAGDDVEAESRNRGTERAERPDVIERAGEGGQSIARNAAIGRGDADHSAEGSGLTDGTAGIGAEREHGRSLRDGSGRSTAGAAGDSIGRDRIAHGTEGRIFIGRSHGELVAVGFSDDDAAGLLDARDGGRVVRRDVIGEQARSAGGADAFA